MSKSNDIYFSGFKIWLDIGGGKSTIMNYSKSLYKDLIELMNKQYFDNNILVNLNVIVNKIKRCIPKSHKKFFLNLRNKSHIIIGSFLFTHAGIDPDKSLKKQGIGYPKNILCQNEFLTLLMIRDKFLWRDSLPNCPYYVIHGHTPSEKKLDKIYIADRQKNFRLCIDSKVYDENGSLTYFYKDSQKYEIFSFPKNDKIDFLSYL